MSGVAVLSSRILSLKLKTLTTFSHRKQLELENRLHYVDEVKCKKKIRQDRNLRKYQNFSSFLKKDKAKRNNYLRFIAWTLKNS